MPLQIKTPHAHYEAICRTSPEFAPIPKTGLPEEVSNRFEPLLEIDPSRSRFLDLKENEVSQFLCDIFDGQMELFDPLDLFAYVRMPFVEPDSGDVIVVRSAAVRVREMRREAGMWTDEQGIHDDLARRTQQGIHDDLARRTQHQFTQPPEEDVVENEIANG